MNDKIFPLKVNATNNITTFTIKEKATSKEIAINYHSTTTKNF